MFYLFALILALLDPTAFAFGLALSVCCMMFALGFFYVNARIVLMIVLVALMRFFVNTVMLPEFGDLNADHLTLFTSINSALKWLDLLMGIGFSLLVVMGVVNGRPMTGLSMYEVIRKYRNRKKVD
ncbi:hypothetical protein [Acinetobacter baumannii]|uniref:hypothetical protein n=1 Tax=Acinetobacter baumannii TaxID=470 RepID=UPI000DF1ABD2|nr:hypothetical protein [Acinetobacter baumannii]RCT89638.1 hypothetical protein DVA68_15660 [Acinetobacter baumannii]